MFVVGLTGGIGSGKTTVAHLFEKKGITLIDADLITRELTRPEQPVLHAIADHFGKTILNSDQTLDRAQLRKLIFQNPAERIWLEKLLHPLVRQAMNHQAEMASSPYCIAIIPLLFETEKNPLINRVLVVDTPEKTQIERAQKRDQVTPELINNIIRSQLKREERLARADDVIDNGGSLEALVLQVEKLHTLYLMLAHKTQNS